MLKSFPIQTTTVQLLAEDFVRFSKSYGEILQKHIPTVESVIFAHNVEQFERYCGDHDYFEKLQSLFNEVLSGDLQCGIHEQCLLLPFDISNGEKVVAILDKPDELFRRKVSNDWLLEIRSVVVSEFQLLKQVRVDTQTGLLNLSNLFYLLDTYGTIAYLHLILVEIPAKKSSYDHILHQSKRCATLLQQFFHGETPLHHLGQSTFALVLKNSSIDNGREIESSLVAYLKKAACHRVYVGSSCIDAHTGTTETTGRQLLDQAWTALHYAAQKGPFSFCNYNLWAHPEKGALALPDRNMSRKLGRLWSKSKSFSLVHFKSDSTENSAANILNQDLLVKGKIIEYGEDILVFLDGANKKVAFDFAKDTIKLAVNEKIAGATVSAGVSCFPYKEFKKSDILFNCQKALIHAEFFGDASCVVFDAVTLNISGDLYFSDGDLAKAVSEYRKGLKCDAKDVNLHNSLGVALVMTNKLPSAMKCFKDALKIDAHNFMALYNLGLAEQARHESVQAHNYLKKALQYYTDEDGGKDLLNDLQLQLGILACDIGKYEEANHYLLAWLEKNSSDRSSGRTHYYIGKAYWGLKENRKAMASLQRALRFNEFDDRAMNLLGKLYLEEKQGDKIALSLCRKSVELEPKNILYRKDLARVQIRCDILDEGRDNLRRCLKIKEFRVEAQIEMARSYIRERQSKKAKIWYTKVLTQQNVRKSYLREAEKAVTQENN